MNQTVAFRKAKLFGAFQIAFTATYLTLTGVLVFILSYHIAERHPKNWAELSGLVLSIALIMFAVSQISIAAFALRFMKLQMQQAEEVSATTLDAQRETNRLLLLLTKRPEPQPAQMNLALFNLPKSTS